MMKTTPRRAALAAATWLLPAGVLLAAALPAAAQSYAYGVTVYSGQRLTGVSETFSRDVETLRETRFGTNRVVSVRVSPGCKAILYEKSGFRGQSVELRDNDNDLGNTPLGRNQASSLRVWCRGNGPSYHQDWDGEQPRGYTYVPHDAGRGVTLYRDRNAQGPSQTFDRDVSDLSYTRFGDDKVSSLDVSPGCEATLFSERNFRGRSTTFRERDNNLSNTPVGEDTTSSLRIRCNR